MTSGRKLYELAGEGERRFSPFCWAARLSLAHKGLDAELVPVRFSEKDKVAFSGQELVPVLVDGDKVVPDSWDIACYLDVAYSDQPALIPESMGRAGTKFINNWKSQAISGRIFPMIAADLFGHLHPADQAYFRQSREARLGKSLEDAQASREDRVGDFRRGLEPLRQILHEQPFIAGTAPAFADYAVFGPFQWARISSPFALLEPDDPIYAWRGRMLELYDGLAAGAVGYEVG